MTPGEASEASTLTLPDLIQGQWASAVILTYGADLTFFEGRLLQQLAQVPLRLVLADERQLADKFAELGGSGQRLRHANRTYAVTPIRHPRPAHAKMILLLGPQEGLLVVGSGNLGYGGYASPGELWNVFRYRDDNRKHVNEFRAARSLIEGLDARQLLDEPVRELLPDVWGTAPWLPVPSKEEADSAVRHNLEVSLIDQLFAATAEPVEELVAHAPFHDADCSALESLITRFAPRHLKLLVSCDTSVDLKALARVIEPITAATVERVEVSDDASTYIHAKWVHLKCASTETLLTGSANLSRSALLRSADDGNIEAGIISKGPPGAFNSLYSHLDAVNVSNVRTLDLKLELSQTRETVSHRPVVRWTRLDGQKLTLVFDRSIPPHPEIVITDEHGALRWVDATAAGHRLVLDLDIDSTARIEAGGALEIRWQDNDQDSAFSWPYQVEAIRGRMQRAETKVHLHRIRDLPDHDSELLELLNELEGSLIFDLISTWRVARPNQEPPEIDDAAAVKLKDLDWERIRRDPRFTAYDPRRAASHVAPTEIQVILAGITGRLGELGFESIAHPEMSDDDQSLVIEEDVEEAEAQSTDETDDEDGLAGRPLSVTQRTRMAFTRFVKRYVAALDDADFVDQLGPAAAVTNAVIFSELVRGLLKRDAVDPDHAARAQIATWRLLWGDLTSRGLLNVVDAEHRHYVEQILDESQAQVGVIQDLLSVTMEILDRETRIALRNQVRHLLLEAEFDMLGALLHVPAPTEQARYGNARLLSQHALHTEQDELSEIVVGPMNLDAHQARWDRAVFRRGGRDRKSDLLVLDAPVEHLDPSAAVQALQRLALAYQLKGADDSYLRIRFQGDGNSVAFWDAEAQNGYVRVHDLEEEFFSLEPVAPQWLSRLQDLLSLWDLDASAMGA